MAIESRGTGQYYYRKRRIGSRVVSEYVGAGYLADLTRQLDESTRQESQEQRQAWQSFVDAEKQLDAQLDEVTEAVNAYAGVLMLVSGYHLGGNRVWRKKRK